MGHEAAVPVIHLMPPKPEREKGRPPAVLR
jgi:hypothetical protein